MRIAILSLHTSPLQQPGEGDAGGLNVYVVQLARQLAAQGCQVEIFTADRRADLPDVVELAPGVRVHQLRLPGGTPDKEALAGRTDELARALLDCPDLRRAEVIHSHYWLSGRVGLIVRAALRAAAGPGAMGPPLIHTMHTMAKVKNRDLAANSPGSPPSVFSAPPADPSVAAGPSSSFRPEPAERIAGEERLVAEADYLIANTEREARELIELYGARPADVAVAAPGVDHEIFRPGDRDSARRRLGLVNPATPDAAGSAGADAVGPQTPAVPCTDGTEGAGGRDVDLLALFVGRIQYLKGPDVLIDAVAALREEDPAIACRLTVAVLGGSSGADDGLGWIRGRVAAEGLAVAFRPPVPATELALWYQAADVVVVPSRSESFGLVAAEAGACAIPVIAADVGGLRDLVDQDSTGVLVAGHNPADWADALRYVLADDERRRRMGEASAEHISQFSWEKTASLTASIYRQAILRRQTSPAPGSAGTDPMPPPPAPTADASAAATRRGPQHDASPGAEGAAERDGRHRRLVQRCGS